jgi:hypothetical protein
MWVTTKRVLPSSGLLRGVRWCESDVSEPPTSPIFRFKLPSFFLDSLTLSEKTDMQSRNVAFQTTSRRVITQKTEELSSTATKACDLVQRKNTSKRTRRKTVSSVLCNHVCILVYHGSLRRKEKLQTRTRWGYWNTRTLLDKVRQENISQKLNTFWLQYRITDTKINKDNIEGMERDRYRSISLLYHPKGSRDIRRTSERWK